LSACAQPKYESREPTRQAGRASAAPAALSLPVSGLNAWIAWEQMPTEEDFGSFLLKIGRVNKADGSPIPADAPGEFKILLWMPSMGHGSTPVVLERVDVGTYRASQVFFTMPGDWEIRVQRTSEEFGLEETSLALRI